ncbi:MAG: IPTL-CTERM sorting domain-containing protein [Bacteroidetes bacterium]|nr:IPTL-CTERM sorting domain-containing protein [Bacteroidota bacterium]
MKKIFYSIIVTIILVMLWNDSYAFNRKRYTVCNNTGGAASYFQATFTGTGGNLGAVVIVDPCGWAPTITFTVGGTIACFAWGANCVASGACVTFDVYTTNGPLAFTAGYWASTSTPNFPGIGAITSGVNLSSIPILMLNSNCYLASGNQYRSSNPFCQYSLNSFFDVFGEITTCQPMPVSGSNTISTVMTIHGNSSSGSFSVNSPTIINLSFDYAEGNTKFYNTEMISLIIGGLPGGIMIRESPTLASTGRTSLTDDGGQYVADSFFDVFFEISIDGGQTWYPSQSPPTHLEFNDNIQTNIIPTLSQWGLIILGFVLICMGIFYIRKRRMLIS